jgi:hypothetical protein
MNRQASYSQSYQAAPTHRYPSTSSAFSASANPNEDWTKISDLAERRRIQNRIAQRNYRKLTPCFLKFSQLTLNRQEAKEETRRPREKSSVKLSVAGAETSRTSETEFKESKHIS